MNTQIHPVPLNVFLSILLVLAVTTPGFAQDQPMPGMPTGATTTSPEGKATSDQAGLTLTDLEQVALSNNPTLAQAAAEIRAATARKLQGGLYPNPTVGYQGEQIRGGDQGGGEQGFFVSQDIVLGGKLGLNRRVLEQEKKQAEAEGEEQRLRVINSVRMLYYQALAAQEMVDLRHKLSKLAEDAVQTSHQLGNVGQADQPDVLQAEVEGEQAGLAVVAAEQNQFRAWRALVATVGKPEMALTHLAGSLEEIPEDNPDQWLQAILQESPAVKIAQLGVLKAEASVARAKREPIPDLQLRGGLQQNRELDAITNHAIGLQGFAEIGVQIPIFNRNQGNVQASRADVERAQREVQRVQLVLRERAAAMMQNYMTSRSTVERYRNHMIPRAQKAYELYLKSYGAMAAAYPQVLVSQRTLFQLQTDYIVALENLWTNSIALKGFLLTDGLESPARSAEIDRPVRELNMPSPTTSMQPQ
ncbi:MAG TPA: TolC family protein [Candidatus Binatia bacterium]|nr:TolC family protein [Candidatus Binatia bacterium]